MMKNLSLKLFDIALLVFAISVVLTMYSMTSGDEDNTLLGLSYSYYLLPLLIVNILICFANLHIIRFKSLSGLMIVWIMMVSLNVIFGGSRLVVNLIRVNLWTTSFLAAFILVRTNENAIDNLIKLFLIIYFISFIFFWQGKIFQQDAMKIGMESATNAIYCLISIVPFILFMKKKSISILLLFITFVCTVFSNKRGATIIMALILIPTINAVFSNIKKKFFKNILVISVGILIVWSFIYIGNSYVGGRLLMRFNEIDESGGAGRLEIWTYVLSYFQNSSFIEQLFGHGHRAVNNIGWASAAHNDFIEVLFDYGIVGLIVYLLIHFVLINRAFQLRKTKNPIFLPYISMYLIFFIMSMVSILIVQQRYLIYMAVFWGMLEGCNYNYQLVQNNTK